jgi:alpha-beta hydrolase superfamily lysophospholipase
LKHADLPIASLTASAPFLGIKVKVPVAKKSAAMLLSRIWGSLQLNTELDAGLLSHDPAVVEAYNEDRLVHSKMTPRFFMQLQAAMKDTLTHTRGIACPVMLQIPLQDGVVDSEMSLGFFRDLVSSTKELKTYPQFFHEIYNEAGKEQPLSDLREWIVKNSRGAGKLQ